MAKLPAYNTGGFKGGRRGAGGAGALPRALVDLPIEAPRGRANVLAAGGNVQRAANIQAASASRAGNFLDPFIQAAAAEGQERQNIALKQMDTDLSDAIRELTTGEGGLYTLEGQNLIDAYPGFQEKLNKKIEGISANAPDGRVAERFKVAAGGRAVREMDQASRHMITAQRTVRDQTSKAMVDAAVNDAIANPSVAGRSATIIRAEVANQAKAKGWDKDVTAAVTGEALSNMHASVIDNLAVNSPGAAKAYYEANKDDIDESVQTKIDAKLRDLVDREWTQAATDEIRALQPGDLNAQLTEAFKIEDGVRRDEVAKRLRTRMGDDNTVRILNERQLRENAWNIVENELSTDSLTPEMRSLMTGPQLAAMDTYIANKKAGVAIVTDPDFYHELSQMSPGEFIKVDLYENRLLLDGNDFKRMEDRQFKIRGAGAADLDEAANVTRQINGAILELDLDDDADKGRFRRVAERELEAAQRRKGADLTTDERQDVLDRLMMNVADPGWIWNDEEPLYKVRGTEEESKFHTVDVTEIPYRDRQKITAALEAEGIPVTNENILHIYNQRLGLQ